MQDWKLLRNTNNQIEAEIIKSYLESSDIEVKIKSEAIGQVYGLAQGPLAEAEVYVRADKYEEAKMLLQEFEDNEK